MRVSLRFVVPLLAAVLLAGGLLGLAWWQLNTTQTQLQDHVRALSDAQTRAATTGSGSLDAIDAPIDAGDVVLIHLRKGDLLALQGDWITAEKEYQLSVDAGGGIPALRKLAQAQMQRREIPQVQLTIQKLQNAGARSEDLLLLQVIVGLRTGEMAKAQDLLTKAPDSPQKNYGAALLAIVQGRNEDAQKSLQAVTNGWDPTLRSYAKTLKAAYDEFALFPESQPLHLTTLVARGLAQVQECELALPLLGGVLSQQNDYRDAWMVQGYCELTTERFPEALGSFQKAYAIDPEKPEIQYFLGRTYMALKQWKNASTFLQYAVANGFDPKKEAVRQLAVAAEEAGDRALALAELQQLVAEPDADIDLFEKTVSVAIGLGKNEDAYQLAQAALKKWPGSAKPLYLAGWAASVTNRKDEAKTDLEQALKLDPTLSDAREKLNKL